jgi:tetratricopeptide (TPR) repeat protein
MMRNRLSEARQVLSTSLREYPHEATLLNFLGVVNAKENKLRAAEEDFRKAILETPDYTGPYLNLGHLYQTEIGRKPDAISAAGRIYKELISIDPANVEANEQLAALQMQQGQYKESLGDILRLPLGISGEIQNLAILCADRAALGQKERTGFEVRRMLASPSLAQADVLPIIPVLRANNEERLAIELLEGLRRRHIATSEALVTLAMLYERTGQLDCARSTLSQIALSEPTSLGPLVQLAQLASRQHDYRGALGYLAHAQAIEPKNARLCFLFGMVCVELELQKDAYASLKKAVGLDPDNPYYNYALGAVVAQREDPREAIPYFQRYCTLRPRDPRGKLALGEAYYYSHALNVARTNLLEVVDEQATAAGASYYLGRIGSDEERWHESERYFQDAIRYNPRYVDAYAMLGHVYLQERRYRESEKALRLALKLDPDSYWSNLWLMVVYGRTKDPRATAQAQRFHGIQEAREEREKLFLRTVRIVPY